MHNGEYMFTWESRMKYIVYGINRVAKDFMYIFEELNIIGIIDDYRCEQKYFEGIRTYRTVDFFSMKNIVYDKIIICDFDKQDKVSQLEQRGLIYKKDYLFEEDFINELAQIRIPQDRKIAAWGIGGIYNVIRSMYKNIEFALLVDSVKYGKIHDGKMIYSPEDVSDFKEYFFVIPVMKSEEIKKHLEKKGLKEYEDFVDYATIVSQPSEMLKKTIFDKSYYELTCNTILNHLEVHLGGSTRYCCSTFLRYGVFNVMTETKDTIWNSLIHKILCLSTENGTFTFCDKNMCPLFVKKHRNKAIDIYKPYKRMSASPKTLALSFDNSCNLACITCRNKVEVAMGCEKERIDKITDKIIEEYIGDCEFMIMAGNGEVFLSPFYKKVYEAKNCKPRYVRLLSNGTLFNESNWKKFRENHPDAKIMLTVSIDAATKETYEKIRRNGNFDILKANMEYAAKLRQTENGLVYFRLNFVVQRENYQEMPLFVDWGEQLGVDEVFFTKLLNWGTYTTEEFEKVSMMEKDEITPKKELLKVLNNPMMKKPIVDMGTIQYAHIEDNVDIVENYYMWELEKRGGKLFD